MAKTIDGIDFLARGVPVRDVAVVALVGDALFLQHECLRHVRQVLAGQQAPARSSPQAAGDLGDDFSFSRFPGETTEWRRVADELSTVAMFSSTGRVVALDDADGFVSRYRAQLEIQAAKPARANVLVLLLSSLPSNTRLYKAICERGLLIECKTPAAARLGKWAIDWASTRHETRLMPDAAELLVDLVEPDMGLVDQELAKLAALAGAGREVTCELVQQNVGSWRTRTTWDMLDAALEGHAAAAFQQLDRLLLGGEVPIAILAQIGATLRRFAATMQQLSLAETAGRRMPLREALERAGFKSFVLSKAEAQLRRLGRPRASQLDRWLLHVDLDLKGSSSAPTRARLALEQLIARLAAPATARV